MRINGFLFVFKILLFKKDSGFIIYQILPLFNVKNKDLEFIGDGYGVFRVGLFRLFFWFIERFLRFLANFYKFTIIQLTACRKGLSAMRHKEIHNPSKKLHVRDSGGFLPVAEETNPLPDPPAAAFGWSPRYSFIGSGGSPDSMHSLTISIKKILKVCTVLHPFGPGTWTYTTGLSPTVGFIITHMPIQCP